MRTFHRLLGLAASVACLLSAHATQAAVQVFEGNEPSWSAAVSGASVQVITFDTIPGSTTTPIAGTEFSTLLAGPRFTSVIGNGVYVGNPARTQIPKPPSGLNMLSPSSCSFSCEGVVRVTFDTPVFALGGVFVDVENEFALTGYSLILDAPTPSIKFTSAPGDRSFKFLGFVSDQPFSSVDIHFTTGPSIDGALLDNLTYAAAPVPEPTTVALAVLGLLAIGISTRRQNRI